MAALEHAADGLARDAHGRGGLLVAEALEVDEADRLELVDRELQMLELAGGDARRLEERDAGDARDGAFDGWARHPDLSPGDRIRPRPSPMEPGRCRSA